MNAPSIIPLDVENRRQDEKEADSLSLTVLVDKFFGFVRRQIAIFVVIVPCFIVLGLVYLLTTPPKYTAHATLLIDSSKLKVLQQQQGPTNDPPLDTSQVDSQVELLKSDSIGLAVVKRLKLNEDPEFIGNTQSFFGRLFGRAPAKLPEFDSTQRALAAVLQNRAVGRVGRSYALQIDYTSLSAARAAEIANAIADAYIEDQLDAKYEATRRGGSWLQDRIAELRTQATDADRAVLDYKEHNKIVDVVGPSGGTAVRLLGEQQLSDLNAQLGSARAAAAEAQAKLDRINDVLKHDVADATVSDSLNSTVISQLRNEYYELRSKEQMWAGRYGNSHIAVVNLRTQIDTVKSSMQDELRRIASGYKSDYEIAKSRVDKLEKDLATLVSGSQSTNRDRLGLRELESAAQSYHAIYDNFLQRYTESIQQQSFPITETRLISRAVPPSRKSAPKGSLVMAIAGVLGLMLSLGGAAVREMVDRVFRTTRQVETVLKTNCLAVLPMLKASTDQPTEKSMWKGNFDSELLTAGSAQIKAALNKLAEIASEFDFKRNGTSRALPKPNQAQATGQKLDLSRYVVEQPLSIFAEAFRFVKVAIDLRASMQTNKVIGITSTLPAEGKSTVSSNLAQSISHSGKNVILIDGDLRNPALTRSLAPSANVGLVEVLAGEVGLDKAIRMDRETDLVFLPAFVKSRIHYPNELLASDAFKRLLETLRKQYDYVIVDLPPVAPVIDARAVSHFIDSFIYVVEWGQTETSFVQRQLEGAPAIANRLLGVILNKTNVKKFERYEGNHGKYQYSSYYGAPNAAAQSAERA